MEIHDLIKRFPWMDRMMAETLIKLEDEGKLQPLLESIEKNNDDDKETPCEDRNPS